MTNPNIVNVTSIYGKTITADLTTAEADILANTASSGTVYKINTIIVANVDGSSAADVTIKIGTGTHRPIVNNVSVPAGSTLMVLDKNSSLYLEEDFEVRGLASANGALTVIVSYEEIS